MASSELQPPMNAPDAPGAGAAADAALAARARRAYERGRVILGLRTSWPVAFLVPVALVLHGPGAASWILATAALLVAVVTALVWRGGGLGRGAPFGLLAGLAPLVAPALVRASGHGCAECHAQTPSFTQCLLVCSIAGVLAGAAVGLRAARQPRPEAFAAGAAVVAALAGLLGCSMVGLSGVLGIVGGLLLATPPALLVARARA